MKQKAKRVALSALTTVVATASLTLATTTQASAIGEVPCSTGEFLHIDIHPTFGPTQTLCYANAGSLEFGGGWWITKISTGNNRVQWRGDGRWQPDTPINKWTVFTWPSHPGGVSVTGIRII